MTTILFVGYRTRLADPAQLERFKPEFTAPSNWVDVAKIAAHKKDKEDAWTKSAANNPYTGTFDCVFLSDPKNERVKQWDYREPGSTKPRICVSVADWILRQYPKSWSSDLVSRDKAEVSFVGFNPRLFLKMLGIECSLPEVAKPLPPGMWLGNADHRDIGNLIMPDDSGYLPVLAVLERRGIVCKEGWTGPGQDPVEDVRIATELAAQLGLDNF